jgi:hypothetical protein
LSTIYKQEAKQTNARIEPPETKLDIIKRIWEEVLPHRELIIGGGKIETRIKGRSTSLYNAAEMSDGERVIFYLIGQTLAAPRGGIIVIDEPELHLHESIQSTLWNKIEAERPDCLFVYLTHDLDFAASRSTATKVCLRSFDGQNWDWYIVPENSALPEEMLLEILGSRKPVIFVEGDKGSLDYFIFQKLYPDFTIIPCGSCEHVIHATRSFYSLRDLHRLSSYGIIDRDFREDNEVSYLQGIGIYVLEFSELENLLLTKDVLRIVADELHRDDFPMLFDKVKSVVFENMERDKVRLISSITASKIERDLKNFDAKALGENNLKTALESISKRIDVSAVYRSVASEIENILRDKNYHEAIKVYSNKGLIYQISSIFGFKSNELVEFVQRMIASKEGGKVIDCMKSKSPKIQFNNAEIHEAQQLPHP